MPRISLQGCLAIGRAVKLRPFLLQICGINSLVESLPSKQPVVGSIPTFRSTYSPPVPLAADRRHDRDMKLSLIHVGLADAPERGVQFTPGWQSAYATVL